MGGEGPGRREGGRRGSGAARRVPWPDPPAHAPKPPPARPAPRAAEQTGEPVGGGMKGIKNMKINHTN